MNDHPHKLLSKQYIIPSGQNARFHTVYTIDNQGLLYSTRNNAQSYNNLQGKRIYYIYGLGYSYNLPSSVSKKSACNARDLGSIPGLGRSPGEGNGNPFQYSCLENLMDRGAWRAPVHGIARVRHDLATKLPPPYIYMYVYVCVYVYVYVYVYLQLNEHEFEQTPGDSEEQGSLACCSPWGHKELDMT